MDHGLISSDIPSLFYWGLEPIGVTIECLNISCWLFIFIGITEKNFLESLMKPFLSEDDLELVRRVSKSSVVHLNNKVFVSCACLTIGLLLGMYFF